MSRHKHHLLVIDDDATLLRLMQELFEDEGMVVTTAIDGAVGIAKLSAFYKAHLLPCLMIVDLMMPKVSGIEIIAFARKLGQQLPIIAMSANTDALFSARQSGANTVLSKPFDIDELLSRIHGHCALTT